MEWTPVRRALPALVAGAALLWIAPSAEATTLNVHCNSGGNLQNKIAAAPSGSTILIEGTCQGHFTIPGNKTLTLKGNPSATLDGMGSGRTLSGGPDAFHLAHLTVTGGHNALGAGVFSNGGLTLNRVTVANNTAADDGLAHGGGVAALGNIRISASTIRSNRARSVGGANGQEARGGGVEAQGNLTITDSVISRNLAKARWNDVGGAIAGGGGVYAHGTLTVTGTKLANNRIDAVGPGSFDGGSAVFAEGAVSLANDAITENATHVDPAGGPVDVMGAVAEFSPSTLSRSTVTQNTTAVDSPGSGFARVYGAVSLSGGSPLTVSRSKVDENKASVAGPGGNVEIDSAGIGAPGASVTARRSSVYHNSASAGGAPYTAASASVFGSAIDANSVRLVRSTVSRNSALAAADAANTGKGEADGTVKADTVTMLQSKLNHNRLISGSGSFAIGQSAGAGVYASTVRSRDSTISRNYAEATNEQQSGAFAFGGGVYADAAAIRNSTVTLNHLRAYSGFNGSRTVVGGGVSIGSGQSSLVDDTIAGNIAEDGNNATYGGDFVRGGGVFAGPATTLRSTIVGLNSVNALGPDDGFDCYGGPTSGGYNLIGDDSGCSFTKKATDKVNKDPKLDPLASNGGPTETILLQPASPALNAVPTSVCPIKLDQRGVHRPQGPRCDIGAVEDRPGEG